MDWEPEDAASVINQTLRSADQSNTVNLTSCSPFGSVLESKSIGDLAVQFGKLTLNRIHVVPVSQPNTFNQASSIPLRPAGQLNTTGTVQHLANQLNTANFYKPSACSVNPTNTGGTVQTSANQFNPVGINQNPFPARHINTIGAVETFPTHFKPIGFQQNHTFSADQLVVGDLHQNPNYSTYHFPQPAAFVAQPGLPTTILQACYPECFGLPRTPDYFSPPPKRLEPKAFIAKILRERSPPRVEHCTQKRRSSPLRFKCSRLPDQQSQNNCGQWAYLYLQIQSSYIGSGGDPFGIRQPRFLERERSMKHLYIDRNRTPGVLDLAFAEAAAQRVANEAEAERIAKATEAERTAKEEVGHIAREAEADRITVPSLPNTDEGGRNEVKQARDNTSPQPPPSPKRPFDEFSQDHDVVSQRELPAHKPVTRQRRHLNLSCVYTNIIQTARSTHCKGRPYVLMATEFIGTAKRWMIDFTRSRILGFIRTLSYATVHTRIVKDIMKRISRSIHRWIIARRQEEDKATANTADSKNASPTEVSDGPMQGAFQAGVSPGPGLNRINVSSETIFEDDKQEHRSIPGSFLAETLPNLTTTNTLGLPQVAMISMANDGIPNTRRREGRERMISSHYITPHPRQPRRAPPPRPSLRMPVEDLRTVMKRELAKRAEQVERDQAERDRVKRAERAERDRARAEKAASSGSQKERIDKPTVAEGSKKRARDENETNLVDLATAQRPSKKTKVQAFFSAVIGRVLNRPLPAALPSDTSDGHGLEVATADKSVSESMQSQNEVDALPSSAEISSGLVPDTKAQVVDTSAKRYGCIPKVITPLSCTDIPPIRLPSELGLSETASVSTSLADSPSLQLLEELVHADHAPDGSKDKSKNTEQQALAQHNGSGIEEVASTMQAPITTRNTSSISAPQRQNSPGAVIANHRDTDTIVSRITEGVNDAMGLQSSWSSSDVTAVNAFPNDVLTVNTVTSDMSRFVDFGSSQDGAPVKNDREAALRADQDLRPALYISPTRSRPKTRAQTGKKKQAVWKSGPRREHITSDNGFGATSEIINVGRERQPQLSEEMDGQVLPGSGSASRVRDASEKQTIQRNDALMIDYLSTATEQVSLGELSKGYRFDDVIGEERQRAEEKAQEEARAQQREAERIEREKRRREAESKRRQMEGIAPSESLFPNLTPAWQARLKEAMRKDMNAILTQDPSGIDINRRSFGTCYPQPGTTDASHGWLNDEIIEAYMKHIIAYGLGESKGSPRPQHQRGQTPRYHAFASQFWTTLNRRDGVKLVSRWAARAKIGGRRLLEVDYVFVPINSGAHWTLLVIAPRLRLMEYYDSMGDSERNVLAKAREFVAEELGGGGGGGGGGGAKSYDFAGWRMRMGASPKQDNGSDCGVFAVTTAKMIMLGWTPGRAYGPEDMPVQRQRILAELLNGGFHGDFLPRDALAETAAREGGRAAAAGEERPGRSGR